jgi:hypothetical protein
LTQEIVPAALVAHLSVRQKTTPMTPEETLANTRRLLPEEAVHGFALYSVFMYAGGNLNSEKEIPVVLKVLSESDAIFKLPDLAMTGVTYIHWFYGTRISEDSEEDEEPHWHPVSTSSYSTPSSAARFCVPNCRVEPHGRIRRYPYAFKKLA